MNRKPGEINRGRSRSVKVGSIGTISSLMNRELESSSSSSITPSSSQRNPQSAPVSVSCSERAFNLRKPLDKPQTTVTRTNNIKQSSQENIRPTRGQHQDRISVMGLATANRQRQKGSVEESRGSRDGNSRRSPRSHKRSHHIPMLGSEDVALDKTTPKRDNRAWRVNLVEVVDTNCGIPAGPLSSRLKKLSFAKLSQSII